MVQSLRTSGVEAVTALSSNIETSQCGRSGSMPSEPAIETRARLV
jgi:hypothetical protein